MDKDEEKFEKDMVEAREGHERLHWYIAGFAVGILTLLFNFIKEASPISDRPAIICLKISVWFLVGIIILSPLRNYFSHLVTSLLAQSRREWVSDRKRAVELHNKAACLTKIRLAMTYFSMGLCVAVLIILAIAINRLYLK